MSPLDKAVGLFNSLKAEYNGDSPNLDKCTQQLGDLKIALTTLSFLPTHEESQSTQEFTLARDVLEIGAQLSIKKRDIPEFCRYMSQLKPYYLDYTGPATPSAYKQHLLGLNLLCLLSQNRVADFHTELERLTIHDIQNNLYIQHPISIEQYLMEGNYNKLFLAKGNIPAQNYTFFMDILLGTIRDEIADCMEKSYKSISHEEAKRMLYFEALPEFEAYAAKRNWNFEVTFGSEQPFVTFLAGKKDDGIAQLPSVQLAEQMLGYARELEMII